ncbi:hypothetical protein FBEOM_14328 [Fusarium beomiforme]|uniref:Uncharacterized protein n=1 Tax=Fusarium beomiforme TaxID=44412 RepID=A0A9P5A3X2_9HYPO|nr:hypothetical protein FBEOM_14328 [Fusarium beomiforme]
MSDENEELLIQRYGSDGRKVLRDGLLISNTITIDSWSEIFSDDTLAGQQIHSARDESYWQRREEEERPRPGGNAPTAAGDDDDAFDEIVVSPPAVNSQDREQAVISCSDERGLEESQSQRPSQLPGNSPRRSSAPVNRRQGTASSDLTAAPSPAARSAATRKRKRSGISWEEMREVLAERDVKRKHTLVRRPEGSEDLEIAIKDCMTIMEERGRPVILRIVSWLSEDPINAVIWNALGSEGIKEAWVEGKIGPLVGEEGRNLQPADVGEEL